MERRITRIATAPASRLAMQEVDRVVAEAGRGLVGDRYHGSKHRHVTVQSEDELAEAAMALGIAFDPLSTRRNVTISGPLPRVRGSRFRLGVVEVEVIRDAAPCRILDDAVGEGARDALRRRAGIVCRVLTGGLLMIGDEVVEPSDESA